MRQNVFNSVSLGATFLYKLIWVFLKSLVTKISCLPADPKGPPCRPCVYLKGRLPEENQ